MSNVRTLKPAATASPPARPSLATDPVTDQTSGPVSSTLRVKLRKTAPPDGRPELDIGMIMPSSVGASEAVALFGAREWDFVAKSCQELLEIVPVLSQVPAGVVKDRDINALVQAVSAFAPVTEVEGMIALQAASMHHIVMNCLGRAMREGASLEGRAFNLTQANKAARTFSLLVETLDRHRGKCTTQRVIVENVTVESGGQAVVGAVAGAGRQQKEAGRGHGQNQSQNDEGSPRCAALPSPQPIGTTLSATGVEGKASLPHARGRRPKRRAAGKPQQLETRELQCGDDEPAPGGSRADSARARRNRLSQLDTKKAPR